MTDEEQAKRLREEHEGVGVDEPICTCEFPSDCLFEAGYKAGLAAAKSTREAAEAGAAKRGEELEEAERELEAAETEVERLREAQDKVLTEMAGFLIGCSPKIPGVKQLVTEWHAALSPRSDVGPGPIEHAKQACASCGHPRHGHNRIGAACNQCGCAEFVSPRKDSNE